MGRVAVAGPVTNLVLSALLLGGSLVVPGMGLVLRYGAYINLLIAVFNLIPFGILDGYKVWAWNRRAWVGLFVVSLVSLAYVWSSIS